MLKDRLARAGLALALTLSVAGCDDGDRGPQGGGNSTAASQGGEDAKEAVEQAEEAVLAAFQAKDAERLATHYSEDATVMLAGQDPAKGRQAIAESLGGFMKDENFSIDFSNDATQVAASGDLAYTRGSYTVSYTHPQTKQKATERGSYVSVFKKGGDGEWKVVEDIATPGAAAGQGG